MTGISNRGVIGAFVSAQAYRMGARGGERGENGARSGEQEDPASCEGGDKRSPGHFPPRTYRRGSRGRIEDMANTAEKAEADKIARLDVVTTALYRFGVLLAGEPEETQQQFAEAARGWANWVDVDEDVMFLAHQFAEAVALGGEG